MNIATRPTHPFVPAQLHPLYGVAIGLIIGIGLEQLVFPSLKLIIISSTLLIIAATWSIYTYKNDTLRFIHFFILSIFIGLTLGSARLHQMRSIHADTSWIPSSPKRSDLKATIVDSNRLDQPAVKQNILLQITDIRESGQQSWTPTSRTILWYSTKALDLTIADTIELSDILVKHAKNDDFGKYLLKEGIDATIFTVNPVIKLISKPEWSAWRTIHSLRLNVLTALQKKLSYNAFSLFSSLFLGNRTIRKKHIVHLSEQFRLWGISHHLARSGLHLVIFSFIWDRLLLCTPIPFIAKQLILILIIATYFILSWSSISFIRAVLCFLLYRVCAMFFAPVHTFYVLVFVCCSVLIHNPAQLFFLDFQLSFLLTGSLAWFNQLYSPYKI